MNSPNEPTRPRVLLVAPTIDGTDIGESWVGYQWAHHLSERFDTTVLTYRKRDRPSAVPQLPRARVIEWVEPWGLGRAERLNSLMKPGYPAFYVKARRWIRSAQRRGEHFDVAHQPLPVAMRYPSPLAGLNIPYVIGPVGGSLSSPPGFDDGDSAPWYVGLRRADAWRIRHDRLLRRSYLEGACVLGIAPYVGDALAGLPLQRLEFLAETALDSLPERHERVASGRVRLLFVGRLVRTKGAREAILAMAQLKDVPVSLDIVGDGFDRQVCEALVVDHGLGDRVTFHGSLGRDGVASAYRGADVFVFPSFREPGGNVVFEAMGHQLPIVTCDRGGPGAAVDDSSGFRVAVHSPTQVVDDLAAAIRTLAQDPELRARMGAAARARVERVGMWPGKIDQIELIFASICREPERAPDRSTRN